MIQLNTFKTGGVIYKITKTKLVGKKSDFPKRELWVEVPTQLGVNQKSTLFKFEVIGEETGSLDWYNESEWVDIVFKVDTRKWNSPEGEDVLFLSLKIIDMKKGPNPFSEGKDMKNKPEDLSNTLVSELGDKVKDWANEEADHNLDDMFKPSGGDDTGLPF